MYPLDEEWCDSGDSIQIWIDLDVSGQYVKICD